MDLLVACGLIATKLISIAFKHAFKAEDCPGTMTLIFEGSPGGLHLSEQDNGCGMSAHNTEDLDIRLVRITSE